MSFKIEELNPSNFILTINARELELSLITLSHNVYFVETFGTLNKGFSDPNNLVKIIWRLLLNKAAFENKFEVFNRFILTPRKKTLVEVGQALRESLSVIIFRSSPIIKNAKRQKELLELQRAQTEEKICYGVYFDKIAKRYGLSLADFYQLTLRQVHILLKISGDEKYKELEVQANLHGRKLKAQLKELDIDEQEDTEQEKLAQQAVAKLQSEYENAK